MLIEGGGTEGGISESKCKEIIESYGYATTDSLSVYAKSADLATVATSGSYEDLSDKPTIPSAVTESTVSGWGFTKNAGTITGITMNGVSKGTDGIIDIGTVITEHQDISGKQDKLIAGTNITIASDGKTISATGGSGTTELFWCTYGATTFAEITTAISDGQLPLCSYNGIVYALNYKSTISFVFGSPVYNTNYVLTCSSSDAWTTSYTTLELSSNKVSEISSSSTDTQYPSAEAVYDAIHYAIYQSSGSTFTAGNVVTSGYVTSSIKNVVFEMVCPRRLDEITSITCTSLTGCIRASAGGYLSADGSTAGSSTSTNWLTAGAVSSVACTRYGTNFVRITMAFSDTVKYVPTNGTLTECTNNSVVATQLGVTLSFT